MRLAGKTACFLLFLLLIFPLYADPADEPETPDQGFADAPLVPQPAEQGEESSPLAEKPFAEAENPDQQSADTPLYTESTGEEPSQQPPVHDWPFFFEELFLSEGAFSFDGSLLDEEFLSEENSSDEESRPGEEKLLSEENLSDEETLLGEEIPPGGETLVAALDPVIERAEEEDDFLDEDAFFFEAPPLIFEVPTFETRSLDTVFPNFSQRDKMMVMNSNGLRHSFVKGESPMLIPNPDLEIDLFSSIMKKNPSHLIEALVVVPYNERELDLLDIYNALGRIENIKDHPAILNGNDFYVFTESSRIESNRKRKDISDPSPAVTLPFSETMYLRLKEVNYGNLFIRGDVSISMYGITYSMTNFTDVRYFLVPIMKAERFITMIYLEPVKEGMLIYSMTGFYLPGFIADKVNLTPNINRRIKIFVDWITAGLRKQEIASE